MRRVRFLADDELHDVVRSAQAGDTEAIARVIDVMRPMIRWAVGLYGRGSADTDDLEQEGSLALLRSIEEWDGSSPFRLWAARGLKLRVWTQLRCEERYHARFPAMDLQQWSAVDGSSDVPRSDAAQDIERLIGLADLTDSEERAVRMRLAGSSVADVSHALGVSTREAKRVHRRARDKMTGVAL